MKILRRTCAVLIGVVFVIAGLLKLMDPVGTSLIVSDYLKFFHLSFLDFGSWIAGACLALAETIIGAALITGVWRKAVAVASGVMMVYFTFITLILWILNPNMDCGCFGEAVHLTHAQSFLKNIVLDLLWIGAFLPYDEAVRARRVRYASFPVVVVLCTLFLINSAAGIPLRDFTPYAVGTELRLAEEEGLEDSPMLTFFDQDGVYRDSLALEGKVMIMSFWKPKAVKNWDKAEEFVAQAREAGFTPIVLSNDDVPLPFCYADRRDLVSLNRSNGGVTYISDGQIVSKWPAGDRPSPDELKETATTAQEQMVTEFISRGKIRFHGFILGIFAIMLIL